MSAQPFFQGSKVENEASDDHWFAIDSGHIQHAFPLVWLEPIHQREQCVVRFFAAFEEMQHDDNTGAGHCVE
jgi:hypothetical protein